MRTNARLASLLALTALLALAGAARAEETVPAVALAFSAAAPGCRSAIAELVVPAEGGAGKIDLEVRCEQAPRTRTVALDAKVTKSGARWSVAIAAGSSRATADVGAGAPQKVELAPWTVTVSAAAATVPPAAK